jgi:hypothetical protein
VVAKLAAIGSPILNNPYYSGAEGRADSNNYTISETDPDNYVDVHCGLDNGPYMDVKVGISKTTPTSFLQVLVPNANLTNKMTSEARLHTARAFGRGNTLVALNSGDSLYVGGSTLIHIFGGGVFGNDAAFCSNDKDKIYVCKPTTEEDPATAIKNCEADLSNQILPGSVNIAGTNLNCGKSSYIPSISPIKAPHMDPSEYTLPNEPDCDGRNVPTDISLTNPLPAGLYCVHGGKTLDNYFKNSVTADGVTFYLKDTMTFNFNSNKVYKLSAPKVGTEGTYGAIPGLLFYALPENHSNITINGNSGSYFYGTWLLPGVNIKSFNGTGNIAFRGQLIVGDFDTNGTFDGAMYYDEDYVVTIPASIDLLK